MSTMHDDEIRYAEVPGFPGYRVSSDGLVWTAWRPVPGKRCSVREIGPDWIVLKGGLCKDGYHKVILCNSGKRKYARVNNLILTCFIGPAPPRHVSAHENGIKTDNRLSNLRWSTQKDNIADKKKHGTHQIGDTSGHHVLNSKQVVEIRSRLDRGEKAKNVAADFGVKTVTIYAIKSRRNWKHL